MKPKLLVIGGSHDQRPMILKGRELGCHVIVADGNAAAPAFSLADEALVIDTSNHEALVSAARERGIAGVCTMATNLGPRSVAHVAHALGLPAISETAALAATDKHLMKQACLAAGLPVAAGETCDNVTDAVRVAEAAGFPVLLKAADASGCRGIEPAEDVAEVRARFALAQRESRNGLVVVERYYPDARVIGVESLIDRGRTEVVFSADKIVSRLPRISTAGVTVPTVFADWELATVTSQMEQLHAALGLDCGASHVDLVGADGRWLVIDVGPRLGGGPMIHHLAPQLTGIDMVDFVVRQALGQSPSLKRNENTGVGVERFFYTRVPGRLERCELPDLPEGVRLEWRKPTGTMLRADGPNVDRLGCISLVAADLATAEQRVAEVVAGIRLELSLANGRRETVTPNVLSTEVHV